MAGSTRSSRRCAPARPISWSSRSAPSACRSRCATRSRRARSRPNSQRMKRSRAGTLTFNDIVTRSPRMQAVLRIAEKAAASLIPVLIEGESGVGKELIARAIHGSGERRAKPFVAVNCGAIPENLVESTLFGHEKGAFTGATESHIGKFVEASGGTLFLDEVGELPPAAQVKLLARHPGRPGRSGRRQQAGQGRRAHHLGDQPQPDRRRQSRALPRGPVLSAARVSRSRCRRCASGREDIPDLVRHFLARFAAEEGKRIRAVSAEALALLRAYPWPGNVRQLENASSARSCSPTATRSASPNSRSSRRRRQRSACHRQSAGWPPTCQLRSRGRRAAASTARHRTAFAASPRRRCCRQYSGIARCQRRHAPARGHRSGGIRSPSPIIAADVGSRTTIADRPFHALSQA